MATTFIQIQGAGNNFPQPPSCEGEEQKLVKMNFLEGERLFSQNELRDNDITRYQVTKFYNDQIRKSGYYEQLKHIVEPSLKEFDSPGELDTSGEHDSTVVPGLQHQYTHTRLLLFPTLSTSYY